MSIGKEYIGLFWFQVNETNEKLSPKKDVEFTVLSYG